MPWQCLAMLLISQRIVSLGSSLQTWISASVNSWTVVVLDGSGCNHTLCPISAQLDLGQGTRGPVSDIGTFIIQELPAHYGQALSCTRGRPEPTAAAWSLTIALRISSRYPTALGVQYGAMIWRSVWPPQTITDLPSNCLPALLMLWPISWYPCFWDCAGKHSQPSWGCMYECATLQ